MTNADHLIKQIREVIHGEDRAVWDGAIEIYVRRAMERPATICAQYIEQITAKRTGRGSIVDGMIQHQIEVVREIADRIAGQRDDEERQMTIYFADALGKWVTIPEGE